ncbi:Hypothetical predicted protein [Cloeon dipterum]|uniref:Uncharacterized protein n=1 Tax=Cloeon dipterum TaxID=197152 RepID=A0A8S1CM05_9INSE|nr:Hypothetical predicted protein [Cloeon dipterum]
MRVEQAGSSQLAPTDRPTASLSNRVAFASLQHLVQSWLIIAAHPLHSTGPSSSSETSFGAETHAPSVR